MASQFFRVDNPVALDQDHNPYTLPANTWTDLDNISGNSIGLAKVKGYEQRYGTLSGQPYFLLPFNDGTNKYWIYPSLSAIYITDGTNHFDYTRASGGYNATANDTWNGGILGGVAILNSGLDNPQFLLPSGSQFADLTNWPASTTTKVIKPFLNYLIAMNVTESGTAKRNKIRWSDAAEFGSVPSTWAAGPGNDAGDALVGDTEGEILDGHPLKDVFYIYKTDSVYAMQFIGGNNVFRIYRVFRHRGILGTHCVCSFPGGHFVVEKGDIYVHNGASDTSVADEKVRNTLFAQFDPAQVEKIFCVHRVRHSEVWVCFPGAGNTAGLCNRAAIWNYRTGNWSYTDLPDVAYISNEGAELLSEQTAWASDGDPWDADTSIWDDANFNPSEAKLTYAATNDSKLYVSTDYVSRDGAGFTATVERYGLDLGDPRIVKYVRRIYPLAIGNGDMQVSVGVEDKINEGVTWTADQTFTIGTDEYINVRTEGRYLGIRFKATGTDNFILTGYILEFEPIDRDR